MADIRPFRAWRYQPDLSADIESLTSPLFDVISPAQRQQLYHNPLNSIHLSLPQGPEPGFKAAQTLADWKARNILRQDPLPGIYPYFQYFSLTSTPKLLVRKGFICLIRAHSWEEKQVLRHENTMPSSVGDRLDLLRSTKLNSSPTHGLYRDDSLSIEPLLEEALQAPLYDTEDYQGVRDVLGIIHDAEAIHFMVNKLKGMQVILADGHHRYESSLAYRREQMQLHPNAKGEEPFHYHLMYLSNTREQDVVILPTHRLIRGLPDFDPTALLNRLETYFAIRKTEDPYHLDEQLSKKRWTFGLLLKEGAYRLELKASQWPLLNWHFPTEIKELDLTVLHFFAIEKAIGIPGKIQRESPYLHFSRSLSECLALVGSGEAQAAFITRGVGIEEVEKVCHSGYTMPQKSTYFYPKALCGFLFGSVDAHETDPAPCFSF
jgi:uncharacterized protein (DUF1015 family)